jgi:hypothetical protein
MKLADILLLGLTLAFLIIGIDQSIVLGFSHAYWAFMLALITFFWFTLRKSRKPSAPAPRNEKPSRRSK